MGVSQSIFEVIKSEVIRFLRLQSLWPFFVVAGDLHCGRGGQKGCENEGCELWGVWGVDI